MACLPQRCSSQQLTLMNPDGAVRLRPSRRPWLVAPAIALALVACSSADSVDTPPPGGTSAPSPDATVRAPNGTNMGASPINGGTAAP
jgi:hypothetical protein